MSGEDFVYEVAKECLFNDFTKKNAVGTTVGAITTVAVTGATGGLGIPVALAVGGLLGATGESTVKGVTKKTRSIVGSFISGVVNFFKDEEEIFRRGIEKYKAGKLMKHSKSFKNFWLLIPIMRMLIFCSVVSIQI